MLRIWLLVIVAVAPSRTKMPTKLGGEVVEPAQVVLAGPVTMKPVNWAVVAAPVISTIYIEPLASAVIGVGAAMIGALEDEDGYLTACSVSDLPTIGCSV